MVPINSKFIRKNTKLASPWTSKTPNAINEIRSMVVFIVQKECHQTLTKKIPLIEDKCMKADYPFCFINNEDESFIIPSSLFENTNLSYLLKFPTVN